jgi:hypothetical protein
MAMITEAERAERDTNAANAYREMESDICDVANMGAICAMLVCDGDGRPDKANDELVKFAVYHLEQMLKTLREKYQEGDFLVPDAPDDREANNAVV